eukprot:6252134-Amphidinium_carterae.1
MTLEDYIHRVGRTGRAGATGSAYTFFTSDKFRHAQEIASFYGQLLCERDSERSQKCTTLVRSDNPLTS